MRRLLWVGLVGFVVAGAAAAATISVGSWQPRLEPAPEPPAAAIQTADGSVADAMAEGQGGAETEAEAVAAAERAAADRRKTFEDQQAAFDRSMAEMNAQIGVILTQPSTPSAEKERAALAVVDAHTPAIDAFAAQAEAFLMASAGTPPEGQPSSEDAASGAARALGDNIRALGEQTRATIRQMAAAQAPMDASLGAVQ